MRKFGITVGTQDYPDYLSSIIVTMMEVKMWALKNMFH